MKLWLGLTPLCPVNTNEKAESHLPSEHVDETDKTQGLANSKP